MKKIIVIIFLIYTGLSAQVKMSDFPVKRMSVVADSIKYLIMLDTSVVSSQRNQRIKWPDFKRDIDRTHRDFTGAVKITGRDTSKQDYVYRKNDHFMWRKNDTTEVPLDSALVGKADTSLPYIWTGKHSFRDSVSFRADTYFYGTNRFYNGGYYTTLSAGSLGGNNTLTMPITTGTFALTSIAGGGTNATTFTTGKYIFFDGTRLKSSGKDSLSFVGKADSTAITGYATQSDLLTKEPTLTKGNLTESVTGLQFDNTRQVIGGAAALSLTSGYVIPTTTEQTNWGTAYTNRIATFTTTGSSGAATFSSNTLNIPTYTLAGLGGIGLASLSASSPLSYNSGTGAFSIQVANTSQSGYLTNTDWNTFNGKGDVTLSGTQTFTGTKTFWANLTVGRSSTTNGEVNFLNSSNANTLSLITPAIAGDVDITLPSTTGTLALANQTMYLGTTGVAINRGSGALSLAGVSIDGNAGTVTNGAYLNAGNIFTSQNDFRSDVYLGTSSTTSGALFFYNSTNAYKTKISPTAPTAGDNITIQLPPISGTLAMGTGTANQIAYWSATNTLGSLTTGTYPSLAELSYVKGASSSLQNQLNAKVISPGSNTDNYVPLWDGANSKTLKNGLPFTSALTASTVVIRDGSGASSFLSAYLGDASNYGSFYIYGTTNKMLLTSDVASSDKWIVLPNVSGTTALGTGTANQIAYWSGTNTLGTLTTGTYPSLAELSYVKGVTSVIQTQMDTKVAYAYGELYDNTGASTITTNNTNYVKWTNSTVGAYSGVTGSTANDNLTIDTGKDGTYRVEYSVSFNAEDDGDYYWTVNVAGSPLNKARQKVTATALVTYNVSGTALVALSATNTIDLGCFGGASNVVNVTYVNVNITKVSN